MLIAVASSSLCLSSAFRLPTIRCRAWKANQRAISISGFAFSSPFFSMAAVTRESVALHRPDLVIAPFLKRAIPDDVWRGYHYKILYGQGPSAPRGAYSYTVAGHLSRGFALVAWPAQYGKSGVTTYIISHAGEVYEKDLGPESDREARAMTLFDPDSSWTVVDTHSDADAP